jgi:hypothetical protein
MKRTLFINVGTGVSPGSDKAIDSLAHGILTSIGTHRPDFIVFFGSNKSRRVLESISRQYKISTNQELTNHDFICLENVDDFDSCYECIEKKLRTEADSEIIIDYTTGTKTMAISAAICALLYKKRLSVVNGKRGPNNIVMEGTECVRSVNLFQAYNRIQLDRAFMAFNSYRFEEAKSYIDLIVGDDDTKNHAQLFHAYDLWDKFDHINAFNILKDLKCAKIDNNKGFLGRLSKDNPPKLLLSELVNNAERRIEEGKYDDAVARLYRSIEFISQIKLNDFGLNSGDIDINLLRQKILDVEIINKYIKANEEHGKLKVGLNLGYEILNDLGDEIGKKFIEDNEMKSLLSKRNYSILAHGTKSICKKDSMLLFMKTIDYSRIIFNDIDRIRDQGKFPKLQGKGLM